METSVETANGVSQPVTGYESIEDLGDCEFQQNLIPNRTTCDVALVDFTLDTEKAGKEHFISKYEVQSPEEFVDRRFIQRHYLGNIPKSKEDGGTGNPKNTAWHMTRKILGEVYAAILDECPDTSEGVRFMFADLGEYDLAEPVTLFRLMRDRFRTLALNKSFVTKIGIERDKSGDYDDKQVVGRPVYPKEDES